MFYTLCYYLVANYTKFVLYLLLYEPRYCEGHFRTGFEPGHGGEVVPSLVWGNVLENKRGFHICSQILSIKKQIISVLQFWRSYPRKFDVNNILFKKRISKILIGCAST